MSNLKVFAASPKPVVFDLIRYSPLQPAHYPYSSPKTTGLLLDGLPRIPQNNLQKTSKARTVQINYKKTLYNMNSVKYSLSF